MPRRTARRAPSNPPAGSSEIMAALDEQTPTPRAAGGSHADRAHARFAPSSAHRWLNCPASIRLHEQMRAEPGYVEPPTSAAAGLGQLLHTLSETVLNSDLDNGDAQLSALPAEQRQLILPYIEHVRSLVSNTIELLNVNPDLVVERRYNTGIRDCWGTVDCVMVCYATREVWIIDLKTGHQRVSAEANPQLLIYAIGVLRQINASADTQPWKIHLQIVQPRDEEEPIKSWTTDSDYIDGFVGRVRSAVRAAGPVGPVDEPSAHLGSMPVPGDWCEYCPAASRCPALIQRSTSVFTGEDAPSQTNENVIRAFADPTMTPAVPPAIELTTAQMQFFLNNRKLIRDFLDAVEERARANPPPGWKVVAGQTRRRWTDPDAVVQRLQAAGFDALVRRQPPTISATEALGRGSTEIRAIVQEFAVAPPGGPVLVPASDARPALTQDQVFRIEEG